MQSIKRRDALKAVGTAAATTIIPSKALAESNEIQGPIRLGVIADLHGGLATDAMSRLDAFIDSMQSS